MLLSALLSALLSMPLSAPLSVLLSALLSAFLSVLLSVLLSALLSTLLSMLLSTLLSVLLSMLLKSDWLPLHDPILNANFLPISALLSRSTYHKSAKVSPPPFPKSLGHPNSMNKLFLTRQQNDFGKIWTRKLPAHQSVIVTITPNT